MSADNPTVPPNLPSGSPEKKVYKVGTLTYTKAGLSLMFIWLLWGDFCFQAMESISSIGSGTGGIMGTYLMKEVGANNFQVTLMNRTLPMLIGVILGPIISFKSDRYRSRWGRRIPFMALTAPFLCAFLIGLGYSKDIADFIVNNNVAEYFAGLPDIIRPDAHSLTLITIGFLMVGFTFFNEFVNTVWWYLYADIVPKEVIGRFLALFRIVGIVPGWLFNLFLAEYQLTHMRWIFILAASLYFFGFGLMCLMVREGKYPPVTDVTEKTTFLDKVKLYFRECFSHPIYIFLYLGTIFAAIGASGGGSTLFALQLGQHKETIQAHKGYICGVALLPDGRQFVSAGRDDGKVILWDMEGNKKVREFDTGRKDGKVGCLLVAPNGKSVFAGGDDGNISMWDVDSGKLIRQIPAHGDNVCSMAISPDGKTLASGGGIFDKDMLKLLDSFQTVGGVAVKGYDKTVRLWDVESGKPQKDLMQQDHSVGALAFSPDGKQLVSADGNVVFLWNLVDGSLTTTLQEDPEQNKKEKWLAMKNTRAVTFMPVLVDPPKEKDKFFLVTTWEFTKDFFVDLVSPDSIFELNPAVTPTEGKGYWIATGGDDKLVRVWDPATGKCIRGLVGCQGSIVDVMYKQDLKTLVTGGLEQSKHMAVWNMQSSRLKADQDYLKSFTGYTKDTTSFDAQEKGVMAVTANSIGELHIWDMAAGISLKRSGRVAVVTATIFFIFAFPFGWLVDKFNPIRVSLIVHFVLIPLQVSVFLFMRDYYTFVIIEVLKATAYCMSQVAGQPISIILYPGEKYGQFCSANALCRQFMQFIMSLVAAKIFDSITNNALITDNFRYGALWVAGWMVLTTACMVGVFYYWKKLGGDKNYVAPEPYKTQPVAA